VENFVHGIQCNTTVRHVCFSGTFVRELAPEQWRTMLECIGHLRALEELQIWCSTIPVDVFAHTIRAATRLQKVYFFRVALSGSQEDMSDLADAIRVHPSLRVFRASGFHMSREEVTIDSVIQALAAVPTLETVSLQCSGRVQNMTPFTADSLACLVCSPHISDLYLSRLCLSQAHLGVIAMGVMCSNNLKLLDLFGNNILNDHIILFALALLKNKSLQTLVLPCPADDLSVESCAAIAKAIQVNSTLARLTLPRSCLSDEGLTYIAQGLTVNTTLKKIEVGVSKDLGDKGMEALTSMLENNYELERLVVSNSEKSVKDKVEYYLRLNEVGRGALLRDGKATREQWVEMLIACTEDLDCLFYFITMNPALCQVMNSRHMGFHVIVTEEIRITRRHTINLYSVPAEPLPKIELHSNRRASAF
jgi:hypothetical protein